MNIKIVINLGACIHGNLKINYDAITKEVPFYESYRSSDFFSFLFFFIRSLFLLSLLTRLLKCTWSTVIDDRHI